MRETLLEMRDRATKNRVLFVARVDDLRLRPTFLRLETGELTPVTGGTPRERMDPSLSPVLAPLRG